MKRLLVGSVLIALGLLLPQPALAQDTAPMQAQPADDHNHNDHNHEHDHEHDDDAMAFGAHVHGHAILTLVLEGNEMQLAFQSAAQSVVGFEHKPRTPEQQQEVAAAIAVFNQGDWFSVNADANCELTLAEASTDLTELQANSGHADFYANYQMLCQRPASLSELQLNLFQLLPALQHMDVQWVINGQQGATKTSLANSTVRFN
uniref:Predicted zinc-binding protein n=1 Tax=Rheinheimera sp. BAL341 TaxID=1708203 RepID=A0A486XJ97_9GAMM